MSGDYRIKYIKPDGFVFSPQWQGNHADHGSNADPVTGLTDAIWLDAGTIDNTIDAGMYEQMAAPAMFMFEAEDYEWAHWPRKTINSNDASGGRFIQAGNGTGSH